MAVRNGKLAAIVIIGLVAGFGRVPGVLAAPAGAARKAPAAAAAKDCDLSAVYNAYVNRLQAKVLNNWILVDGKFRVTLLATVAPDGSVTNLNLSSSPQSPAAEQAAVDAFNSAQPLEQLPAKSSPVLLTFTFDSQADPHGDSTSSLAVRIAPVTAPSGVAAPAAGNQPAPATQPSPALDAHSTPEGRSGAPTQQEQDDASAIGADGGAQPQEIAPAEGSAP